MPSKGPAHFETYTEQNRVKHAILTKYLAAYLQALNTKVRGFHYIDGFAGAGTYGEEHHGSPLYALEILANYPKRAVASFVENNTSSRARLEDAIARSPAVAALAAPPLLRDDEFSECLDALLGQPVLARLGTVATFAFVDPCGLKDLYVADLAKVLRKRFAECLVFLNYDGLPRWLGGVRGGTHERERLDRFFGGSEIATDALACFESDTPTREARLLEIYINALHQRSGAKFVLPFRFKATDRNRTSHYLIHLSQHSLAFKIMKDVMRSESSAEDYGSFEFIPDDEITGQLFRPNSDNARAEILDELRRGPQRVSLFLEEWPLRPADMLVQKEYRQLLLELERQQLIAVIDPTTGVEKPAAQRPKGRGRTPTLSGNYEIRLREGPRN